MSTVNDTTRRRFLGLGAAALVGIAATVVMGEDALAHGQGTQRRSERADERRRKPATKRSAKAGEAKDAGEKKDMAEKKPAAKKAKKKTAAKKTKKTTG
ncbi:MAG: hypothetical protein EXQ85_01030 [Alphaproteobacteria bacterium]|nr:hypothetical protein [Alphaproteobacteria bacterium]